MRDNRTRLEIFQDTVAKLTEQFEDTHSHILDRIDAGLELAQFYGQDNFNKARMIQKVRRLIWSEGEDWK